jgi:hypothetical protein
MVKSSDTPIDGIVGDAPVNGLEANRDETEEPRGFDLWIMPYISDSSLWPILVVLIIHVAAFVTPLILYSVRDGRPGPTVAAGIVILLSLRGFYWERMARKKFGAISWLIVTCWITSCVAAYFANLHDFL